MSKKINRYIASLNDLEGKKVIVTGANSGIGFSLCDVLLSKHASIVMACRSEKRANDARNKLLLKYPDAKISLVLYDQSNHESIKSFVDTIFNEHSDFYALMLNAGILCPENNKGEDISLTFNTNYVGLMDLFVYLKPYLDASTVPHKIVFQGSLTSYFYKYKKGYLFDQKLKGMKQYCLSKLGVSNIFINAFKNNANPNIKYLLAEPGISSTNIIRTLPKALRFFAYIFMPIIFQEPIEGCLPSAGLICQTASNGDYMNPKGLLTVKGLPKYRKFPYKLENEDIISDGVSYLNKKYGK